MKPPTTHTQWTLSTAVLDSKWTHAASDERLANHLLASSFNPADIRHHRSRPRQRYDTTHYHAFTRGDAAAGWDISTELPSRRARARAQAAADAIAAHKTAQRRQHTLSPERYTSPVRREEAFAAGLRQQRTAAAAQAAALSQRYGAEGAAAMAAILAMRRPDRRYIRIRATQADLAAVAALPPITCADDEDGQQRQRQQQQ
jgi:hypothetical protein